MLLERHSSNVGQGCCGQHSGASIALDKLETYEAYILIHVSFISSRKGLDETLNGYQWRGLNCACRIRWASGSEMGKPRVRLVAVGLRAQRGKMRYAECPYSVCGLRREASLGGLESPSRAIGGICTLD